MALTQKDLNNIGDVVKDIVEFSIEKSEQRTDLKFEKLKDELHSFREEMHREISDISENNREFLAKLDNHETRIGKLETKIA